MAAQVSHKKLRDVEETLVPKLKTDGRQTNDDQIGIAWSHKSGVADCG
jgi:hypothetical protein